MTTAPQLVALSCPTCRQTLPGRWAEGSTVTEDPTPVVAEVHCKRCKATVWIAGPK